MWKVVVLILSLSSLVYGAPQVPCYFVFGDSYSDSGNNNDLVTMSKANYPPYGIDFPDGPVGRFTNGRNLPDFIAEFLGFENYIPPFANATGQVISRGVNYASGSAGIRDESGRQLGDTISFNRQIINHQITILRIIARNRTAAKRLNKCLYTVEFGINDYIQNYFANNSLTRKLYTPRQYARVLTRQLSMQLKILCKMQARKVAVFGLVPIGCLPVMISIYGTNGSSCVDFINRAGQLFNANLKSLVDDLNKKLQNAKFIYVNNYQIYTKPWPGFKVPYSPCCNVTSLFLCTPYGTPCPNRNEYAFWDGVHSSEASFGITARRAYNALLPLDTYPFDIHTLAKL